jgi:hypothetical protein
MEIMVKMNDSLTAIMPDLDQVAGMASTKKHASWNNLGRSLEMIETKVVHSGLEQQAKSLLDGRYNYADR